MNVNALAMPMGSRSAAVRTGTILVVDDDPEILNLVQDALEAEGYRVELCSNARQVIALVNESKPDLVILDVIMPGGDGINLCREIRSTTNIPVILLSAKGDAVDRVIGLRTGADDYLAKPFHLDELVARVGAVLSRSRRLTADQGAQPHQIKVDELFIDQARHEVRLAGKEIHLTPIEYKLLLRLATHPNEVVSRDALLREVWNYYPGGPTRTVDVHIRRLREKIKLGPDQYPRINTVRSFGYQLVAANSRD